jgi:hypothetical protein
MSDELMDANVPFMSVDLTMVDLLILHGLTGLGLGLMTGASDNAAGHEAMVNAMKALEHVGPDAAMHAVEKLHAAVQTARTEMDRLDAVRREDTESA